jgi:hypothetical protein
MKLKSTIMIGEAKMSLSTNYCGGMLAIFASALLAGTSPARAADVTYERLLNPEPENWLNHP